MYGLLWTIHHQFVIILGFVRTTMRVHVTRSTLPLRKLAPIILVPCQTDTHIHTHTHDTLFHMEDGIQRFASRDVCWSGLMISAHPSDSDFVSSAATHTFKGSARPDDNGHSVRLLHASDVLYTFR